jgi:predicted RNA-binding protein with EMAP domain
LSRRPDRSRSRRIVLVVAVFLAVVVSTGSEDCVPSGETAALALLPRFLGVLGRGLWLISVSGKANEGECPP